VNLNGIVRRLPASAAQPNPVLLETVVCGKCGQRFVIYDELSSQDAELVKKQVCWVEDQLVWDHIQERKHLGAMKLPKLQ
jgi:hypothetical protein